MKFQRLGPLRVLVLASGCIKVAAMTSRLVVVSGGNRGVGIGICRQVLACDATAQVVVTARQLDQAESVCQELNQKYETDDEHRAYAHALDVTDDNSCQKLVEYLESQHLQGDDKETRPLSLVNNAGVAFDLPWFPAPWPAEAARKTLEVNLLGAHRLTQALLPLLEKSQDGRVINVSSGGGRANMKKMSEANRNKLLDETVTWDDIQNMATIFCQEYEQAATIAATAAVALAAENPQQQQPQQPQQLPFLSPSGYWLQSYGFSKACLGSYTQIVARQFPSILSMACSPGFIATDMSKTYPQYDTLKTVDEGGTFVANLATADRASLESGVFYQPETGVVSFVADG